MRSYKRTNIGIELAPTDLLQHWHSKINVVRTKLSHRILLDTERWVNDLWQTPVPMPSANSRTGCAPSQASVGELRLPVWG